MREMRKQTSPSPENIFWFDAGRAYQTGVFMGMSGQKILNEKDFPVICRAIIKRYIEQPNIISELYRSYLDGHEKGKNWREETGGLLMGKTPNEVI